MLLGTRLMAQNDKRLIHIDYKEFLARGATIASVTVTIPAGFASTVGTITLLPDKTSVNVFIDAGAVSEIFTAAVIMTDSTGQIVNDTLQVQVTTP